MNGRVNRIYNAEPADDGTNGAGQAAKRPSENTICASAPMETVDETNAAIGVVRLHLKDDPRASMRCWGLIQNDLVRSSAPIWRLAAGATARRRRLAMLSSQVERLERDIDTALNANLADLTSFVLPGGTLLRHTFISPAPYVAGRKRADGGNSPPGRRSRSATLPYNI